MQNGSVYAIFFTLFSVATIVIAIRLAIRLKYGARQLFIEDHLIILAWLTYVALLTVLSVGVKDGLAASSRGDKSHEDTVGVLKLFFIHGYFIYTTVWLVKASIVAFYARLSWNTSKIYHIITYVTFAILGCSFIVLMFYKSFYCFPMNRIWNPSDQCSHGSNVTEYNRAAFLLTTSLLDIITDLICLILPFSILRNLRISLRKKIALGVLFAIASLTLVCCCVRLSYGLNQGTKYHVALWAVVEATIALCVASAPALRPLFFKTSYFSRTTSTRPGTANSRPRTNQISSIIARVSSVPLRFSDNLRPPKFPNSNRATETNSTTCDGDEYHKSQTESFLNQEEEMEKEGQAIEFQVEIIGDQEREGTVLSGNTEETAV